MIFFQLQMSNLQTLAAAAAACADPVCPEDDPADTGTVGVAATGKQDRGTQATPAVKIVSVIWKYPRAYFDE